jgi:carboxymethylenebutenolidase
MLHHGALDERVNEGWPAFEAALKNSDVRYEEHMYADANHGFHNDTTPRFDAKAAELAWRRTVQFFERHLS